MKKCFLLFSCSVLFILLTTFSFAADSSFNSKDQFNLVHWNILKNTYKMNGYLYEHQLTEDELKADANFVKIFKVTFTPDSYPAILNENAITLIHPDPSLLGKKLSTIKDTKDALRIIKKAINKDTCTRGFYIWTDKEEKYMVVCPLIGKTKDGHKIFYVYTMYSRSMPDYYIKTLKSSHLD